MGDHFARWRRSAPPLMQPGVPGVPGVPDPKTPDRDSHLDAADLGTPAENSGVPGVPQLVEGQHLRVSGTPGTPTISGGVPTRDYEKLLKFQPVRRDGTPGTQHFVVARRSKHPHRGEAAQQQPSAPVDHEWAEALVAARRGFSEHGTRPAVGTLRVAAEIEFRFRFCGDWPTGYWGLGTPAARRKLEQLYRGQVIARAPEDSRTVLWCEFATATSKAPIKSPQNVGVLVP